LRRACSSATIAKLERSFSSVRSTPCSPTAPLACNKSMVESGDTVRYQSFTYQLTAQQTQGYNSANVLIGHMDSHEASTGRKRTMLLDGAPSCPAAPIIPITDYCTDQLMRQPQPHDGNKNYSPAIRSNNSMTFIDAFLACGNSRSLRQTPSIFHSWSLSFHRIRQSTCIEPAHTRATHWAEERQKWSPVT